MTPAVLELCEAAALPADLVDCMACYFAVQAGNRTANGQAPRFPAFRDEALATLASLEETVPGFTPRSAPIRQAIAEAHGKSNAKALANFVPPSEW